VTQTATLSISSYPQDSPYAVAVYRAACRHLCLRIHLHERDLGTLMPPPDNQVPEPLGLSPEQCSMSATRARFTAA
jgi:hypothetical protein